MLQTAARGTDHQVSPPRRLRVVGAEAFASHSGWEELTDRERDVLELVTRGLTNGQIAGILFVSPRTVQSHVQNLLEKIGAATRTELAVRALCEGVLPSPPLYRDLTTSPRVGVAPWPTADRLSA